MTWFIIHFASGSPLGVPSIASGPWANRDLGWKCMADWRKAPEVSEVTEQPDQPIMTSDRILLNTPKDEAAMAVKHGFKPAPPPPEVDEDVFTVRLTTEQRDLVRRAAARAKVSTSVWARHVLTQAAREELGWSKDKRAKETPKVTLVPAATGAATRQLPTPPTKHQARPTQPPAPVLRLNRTETEAPEPKTPSADDIFTF